MRRVRDWLLIALVTAILAAAEVCILVMAFAS